MPNLKRKRCKRESKERERERGEKGWGGGEGGARAHAPPVGRRVRDGCVLGIGNGVGGCVVRVGGDAVARRGDVGAVAKVLLSDGRRARLAVGVGPKVVYRRVRRVLAHVLENDLAVHLGIRAAPVLVGPLDREDGALVEVPERGEVSE